MPKDKKAEEAEWEESDGLLEEEEEEEDGEDEVAPGMQFSLTQ